MKFVKQAPVAMKSDITHGASFLSGLALTREEKLLLACARVHLDQSQSDALAALVAGPINWDRAMNKGRWHHLTPLMFHHLSGLEGATPVPPAVMAQLKSDYLRHVVLNLHFQSQWRRVCDVLEAQGVPVILLKGAALAGTVYQDIGLRPMGDLDLLVREEQVHFAHQAVQSMGYSPVGSTDGDHRHLPRLQREGTAAQVEVHRHIVNRDTTFYFDIAGFWSRARQVTVARRPVRVLAPEDLLIHLAINFFQDRRFKSVVALRQLCDIAESLRFYEDSISWPLFLDNVRAYHLAGPVSCSLYLARALLNAPVPEEAAQRLWPHGFGGPEVERFARRRVLDTHAWVLHALVEPGQNYTLTRVAAAVMRRLFPGRQAQGRPDHLREEEVSGMVRRGAMASGAGVVFRSIIRPDQLREDLALDRWHHSMYGSHGSPDKD